MFRGMALCLLSVALLSLVGQSYGELQLRFYEGKCISTTRANDGTAFDFFGRGGTTVTEVVNVEQMVANIVQEAMAKGLINAAALLRMHFHDCFVRGCDASILLKGYEREKDADANQSVRGYEFIDFVKDRLEEKCPGIVSCADIIVMATRDAVALSSDRKVIYSVKTGRRDGVESRKSDVKLPSPSFTVSQSIAAFAEKKLDARDMVYLLGAHTVGVTHCKAVKDRLYNFNNTGQPDPLMDVRLRNDLMKLCPNQDTISRRSNFPISLDENTPTVVDKLFYDQLLRKRGILQLDQYLINDGLTGATVRGLSDGSIDFVSKFKEAMVKLGEIECLTGDKGQIRATCGAVN